MNESIEIGGNNPSYQVHVDSEPRIWSNVLSDWIDIDSHFEENTVSKVFASHVIEHLTYPNQVKALHAAWNILQPGGVLELDTPDLEFLTRKVADGDLDFLHFQETIYGSQEYDATLIDFVIQQSLIQSGKSMWVRRAASNCRRRYG